MSRWRGLATSACTLASTKTKDSVLPYMSLGLVPYANALRLQDYMVRRRLDINRGVRHDSVRDIVFILEHPPVYTAGKRLKNQEDEGKRLKTLGAEFFETQRGGQLTFHGPGQLVAYPILDIRSYQLNTACYVSHLEQILINVCKSYGIEAQRTQNTGVWVGQDHKIAALGL
ncbi:hypothetical protein BZG36_03323 [Bifiguratus adelaidae]|uniref:lipoyl(octanoyl) transferase n=1 Tax=Bifiguratus adelaidae TaxID=1938954 RepID=A0A261XXT9_9FUNG|nr:hypothetical protein BZG36_03323 [Bifiguratus adelaidae]